MSTDEKHQSTISAEFYARQRIDAVHCAICNRLVARNVHPDEATTRFAAHRATKHGDTPPPKKRRHPPSYSTPSAYEYQRRFQSEEELEWREGRRHIHTVGRT